MRGRFPWSRFLDAVQNTGWLRAQSAIIEPRTTAIGVVYRPEFKLQSHSCEAWLSRQRDEYVWFDETKAVRPLQMQELQGVADTYPFGP